MIEQVLWAIAPTITITPKPPAGVGTTITDFLGIVLWVLMVAAILGLMVIGAVGIQAYRHNQAEEFISKFVWWVIGCVVIAAAVPITKLFFPTLA